MVSVKWAFSSYISTGLITPQREHNDDFTHTLLLTRLRYSLCSVAMSATEAGILNVTQ